MVFFRTAARRWMPSTSSYLRAFSSNPPPPVAPSILSEEMARGVQSSTSLFIKHGIGRQRLREIAADKESPLVTKWQRCMEAFLGTQLHVLAGLGYSPDEKGINEYNQQLAFLMQDLTPDAQEEIRVQGRDLWRSVLSTAFGVNMKETEELSIVDARNMMHKVAERMQQQEILDVIAKKCASIEPNDNVQIEMAQRHHIVQETLVNEVYLGGDPCLVTELGFGKGPQAYVKMQLAMAEHQSDPLVGQYVGVAMMQILKAAGLDLNAMQQARSDSSGKSE